jgi:hypothetical protein
MSANTVFIKSKWISLGKKWGDVPPLIKRAGKNEFLIPSLIHTRILPSLGSSIQEMLAVTLPTQGTTMNNIDPLHFFSHQSAEPITEASITHLRRLPTPTPLMVRKLVELQGQAWLDGFQSIRYMHLGDTVITHFLFWLISFWAAVLDMHKDVCKPWISAREWTNAGIHKKWSPELRELAGDTKAFLAALPWDSEPVHVMWCYLGPHMTTSSQQNDMLDNLSDCVAAQQHLAGIMCVKGLALMVKIMEAAATQDVGTYQTEKSFRWIQELGDDIVQRKQMTLTQHHLGKDCPHWVSLVIDGEHELIWYGDMFGGNIPPDILEAYQWWLSQHTESQFSLQWLPITVQEVNDTSSCGFLVHNSLEHFAFPESVPLLATSGIQVVRMKTFIRTGEQVLAQVHSNTNPFRSLP